MVLEASGGYERPVTQALAEAGVRCARVTPRQARDFARAIGRLAKTDRVHAEIRASLGQALAPEPTPPADGSAATARAPRPQVGWPGFRSRSWAS